MATTSAWVAATAMDALQASGASFAVLHNEWALAAGRVGSDIDMVVDRSALRCAREISWDPLLPVMVWPYDTGAASMFLMTSDGSEGVQLDLTHDRKGRNTYGIRAGELLDGARKGVRWQVVDPLETEQYLLRKRAWKAQGRRAIPRPGRVWTRLITPVGFWARQAGEFDVQAVATRFARVLPRVDVATTTGAVGLRPLVARRLPCLLLDASEKVQLGRPDVRLQPGSADAVCHQLTHAMCERVMVR